MTSESVLAPIPIENQILLVRGQKVLLDADLAALYGVEVRALNQAVKRNEQRFPPDFVFQLTPEENEALRSQTVISKGGRGGRHYAPYVFTEHGAIMAASVLNSPRAVEMSIYVVRAFVHQRETLASHKALAAKLASWRNGWKHTTIQSMRSSGRSACLRHRRRNLSARSASAPMRAQSRRCWRPVRA
jgi:hypothetical protein